MTSALKAFYIDDEPDIREIARLSLLLDPGLEVDTASSGEEALLRLTDRSVVPDVILLDVMMPGVDGPRVLQRIRQIPWLDATPVIFITARAQAGELARFIAQGAAGVITKPFDPMTLARQVREMLQA